MLKDYLLPETTAKAVSLLDNCKGQARIISGGTDLLLDLPDGKVATEYLIDISRIAELKEISLEDGVINIGAAVTHNQVAKSDLIREKAPALANAAGSVGSCQIRNSGTVVGNVVNAQPAADTAVALVALGASAEIVSSGGKTSIPVEKMYAGVGKSIVDSTAQLVTCVKLPAALAHQGSAFVRLEQRKALALPMLNVAVMVSLEEDKFEWVRICMAPVGPGPLRATAGEDVLRGAKISPELINKAARAAANQANPRSSALRGSKEYRLGVLPGLIAKALEAAVTRVMEKTNNIGEEV